MRIAAKVAQLFIQSKITVLLMVAFLAIGLYSGTLIPREEEPQINLPSVDILVNYPGASAQEVETRVARPLEKVVLNIEGVEYVYSTSMPNRAVLSVLFYVGEDVEKSLVKLYNELVRNLDEIPENIGMPLIKSRSIDDVPIMGLTLWSETYSDFELRRLAQELDNEIKKIYDVAQTDILGGRSREVRVSLNKDQLLRYGLTPMDIARQIEGANQELASGSFSRKDEEFLVQSGNFLRTAEDVRNLIVGLQDSSPIYLSQVAEVQDGPGESSQYVRYGQGRHHTEGPAREAPAVTIAIGKRSGADAMSVAEKINDKIEFLKTNLIPEEVTVSVTRNYGKTASEKVNELLSHLLVAILAVSLLVWLSMGWRGALVVFLSVPVSFALTVFVYYLFGYTLNRITLFALVFVTGIVVDDSIIVAENMHRHFSMNKNRSFREAAMYAINEVGNPTILATLIVVAAILPMIFVRGLMGPYMSPMPVGASMAMMFSLLVAFIITPWLAFHLFRTEQHLQDKPYSVEGSRFYKFYQRTLRPMLEQPRKRWLFLSLMTLVLLGSLTLFYFRVVTVKMLPFDDKAEFQVVIDMPEGTTLERTAAATNELATVVRENRHVINYQSYVGTHSPINFNGLVRHYDFRQAPYQADIQVNITDKHERRLKSHDIAKAMREELAPLAERLGADIKVVEMPPGPPVRSTLVAEVYGPDLETQRSVAGQVRQLFEATDGIVDVDWEVEADQREYQFAVDKEKAQLHGMSTRRIISNLHTGLRGRVVGKLYQKKEKEPLSIRLRLPEAERSGIGELRSIPVRSHNGQVMQIGDFVNVQSQMKNKSIHRKNQQRVVYVTGDLAGDQESPVYAILDLDDKLQNLDLPAGSSLRQYFTEQPFLDDAYTLKWDGEWRITYEVFRDLGAAFAVSLVIIYLLIVSWFQSFRAPLVMLIAVPLSLIGIVLGHWLLGAFFTATSMIGMIALAGIMVRNSVLLIDFVNLRLADGYSLKEAVIESATVRTLPILLTAGTVVLGAFIILFDPIFQGLAISLMGGSLASTALTLLVVPLVYYMINKRQMEKRGRVDEEEMD